LNTTGLGNETWKAQSAFPTSDGHESRSNCFFARRGRY